MMIRKCFLSTLLSAWVLPGGVFASSPASDDLVQIKQSLLEQSLNVEAAVRSLPSSERKPLNLYLACDVSSLSLVSASVSVKGSELSPIVFTQRQNDALHGGGWFLAGEFGSGSGLELQVDVVYRASDTPPEGRHVTIDTAVDNIEPDSSLVVLLERHLLEPPSLRVMRIHPKIQKTGLFGRILSNLPEPSSIAEQYAAGGPNDPIVRRALFLELTQDYLGAVTLLRIESRNTNREANPEYIVGLGRALLEYGLTSQASALVPNGKEGGTAKAIDLRVALSNEYFRRSAFALADEVLGAPPSRRDRARLLAWQDAKSQSLLAQRRMAEAASVLSTVEPQADYAGYVRYYNLGIALASSGNLAGGLTILERVGTVLSTDPVMISLSNHANVVVGTHFLKQSQGATAIPVLERIHDQGPDATRAILDLGWAWLAPAGKEQVRTQVGDERTVGVPPESSEGLGGRGDQNVYQRFDLAPFERAKVESSEDGKLRRALSYWVPLADRPVPDDSVIEAMLAIASKLHDIGVNQKAAEYYGRAIAALTKSLNVLDEAERYVSGARAEADLYAPSAVGVFDRELHRLPPQEIAYYLSDSLADYPFRERLADYRDALTMSAALDSLSKVIHEFLDGPCRGPSLSPDDQKTCEGLENEATWVQALRLRLIQTRTDLHQGLTTFLLESLSTRRSWLGRVQRDARFELARVYDAEKNDSPTVRR